MKAKAYSGFSLNFFYLNCFEFFTVISFQIAPRFCYFRSALNLELNLLEYFISNKHYFKFYNYSGVKTCWH